MSSIDMVGQPEGQHCLVTLGVASNQQYMPLDHWSLSSQRRQIGLYTRENRGWSITGVQLPLETPWVVIHSWW